MTCEFASHLMDDYLDSQLSQRDRQRLEKHMAACPRCADELGDRLAFERWLRQALSASVQHLQPSPDANRRVIRAVEGDVPHPRWPHHPVRVARVMAGVVAVILLLVGLFTVLVRIPLPSDEQRANLPLTSRLALSLQTRPEEAGVGEIFVGPQYIQPGDLFTITVPIENDRFQSAGTIRFDLEISGPTGDYRFGLAAKGPLPARGVSVLRVTPDILADLCQEQYQISLTDILNAPGAYTFRVTMFSPAVAPSQ